MKGLFRDKAFPIGKVIQSYLNAVILGNCQARPGQNIELRYLRLFGKSQKI